jgi:peptidoglycan/LPS O-acetylase OafA/YrhL
MIHEGRGLNDYHSAMNGNMVEDPAWATEKYAGPKRSRTGGFLRWVLEIMRPAIFTKSPARKQQLRRTAYLDGLRGFAAFLVYWHHHQMWPRESIGADIIFENAYGFKDKYFMATLPFIRTFFSGGHFAVSIFFVISGYVLATKPLALIYAGDYEKLGDNLSSALFRRWIRLHLPVMFTTFFYMVTWHLFGVWTASPDHQDTFRHELWNWYAEFKNFSFVFRTGGVDWFSYSFHTWSIPVEFRGSLIIYTALLAFSRCTKNARLLCQLGLVIYFMYIADGWFGASFVSGMLLCDLEMLARNDDLPKFFSIFERYKKFIFPTMFIYGIFLGGVPSNGKDMDILRGSQGWYYLSFLKPQAVFDPKWFYLFHAGLFIVVSTPHLGPVKRFFELRFNQYLGRISFSLYLIHGPVLWILGDRLYTAVGFHREAHLIHTPQWVDIFPLSHKGPLGLEFAFLAPHIIILPFTLWLAEVVTKLADEPSVKFSQWLYNKALGRPSPVLS